MSTANQKTFSIEQKINPTTNLPFGSEYAGKFSIRRPSIADKREIAYKSAAAMNAYGPVNPNHIGEGIHLMAHIETYVGQIATEATPEWFDLSKLYDEKDENAMMAVWAEVQTFLDSFRSKKDSGNSGEAEQKSEGVVPPALQTSTD